MLPEMFYVFNLYVVAELSVAAINSSPVIPRILDTLPHRARHAHHLPASLPGLPSVYLLAAVKLRTYLRDSPS